ncbi:type IV pilin PilA [Vibrio cincinnatiensis]|jgi:type IV pilus assembly protein PilA|uniref:Type IV pilus assembly protein PilA n=1 Tax=Vibrio cincinnatiensis DSM 19608 TaxID=1123491 RepID=A0A1T4PBE3_VIBCI|nr:pilin [Vibrio cincinnatiensis]SJZ88677.1 type IV pilus assembly protein PilA [Vibrio cincinnatiensis DSM 19608]SUP47700.1 type IV pilin PilA [Vibrio cincinnatiensis]
MKKNPNHKQQGFTLIELMIVVAIIGVLSAIAVPAYKDYVTKSELASGFATIKSVITPAELYIQETGPLSGGVNILGIAEKANPLGELSFGTDNSIIFEHKDGAAKGAKFTYTREETNGWTCALSGLTDDKNAPKGCPATKS